MKKTIYIITTALTYLFIVLAGLVIISFSVSIIKKERPNLFGVYLFHVETPSMQGTIDKGDVIIVIRKKKYHKDEIITFESINYFPELKGYPITHRIVDEVGKDKLYQTKGDNNEANDDFRVKKEDIIGKYVYKTYLITALYKLFAYKDVSYIYGPIIICFIIIGIISIKEIIKYQVKKKLDETKAK